MNKIIQEVISKRQAELAAEEEKAKKAFLIAHGVCERQYVSDDDKDAEYVDPQTNQWYKKVPLEVSDEEYNILKSLYPESKADKIKADMMFESVEKIRKMLLFFVILTVISMICTVITTLAMFG